MSDDALKSTVFILSWDMYGLEACVNASQIDQEYVWSVLANKDAPKKGHKLGHIMNMMTLRARFNSPRHYEIYSIAVDPGITEETLVEEFKSNPQAMAELIRSRGNKIYSDRIAEKKVLIC